MKTKIKLENFNDKKLSKKSLEKVKGGDENNNPLPGNPGNINVQGNGSGDNPPPLPIIIIVKPGGEITSD